MAYSSVCPAGYSVNDTAFIVFHYLFHYFYRIMLSPSFIEDYPRCDTGIKTQTVNHLEHLLLPLVSMWCGCIPVRLRIGLNMFFVFSFGREAGYHILPHHQTQRIGIIIILLRFYFNVFAYGIKSHIFELNHIPKHCFFGRRCQQTIRPPALIQCSILEYWITIQTNTLVTTFIFADTDLTHRKIAFYLIYYLSLT